MRIIALLALLVLTGCAQRPDAGQSCLQTTSLASRQAQRQHTTRWLTRGKLAIKSSTEKLHANLVWQQQDANAYRITLLGPLGFGAVRIDGKPGQVTLHDGKHTYTANSPEALMQQQLNWHLPVSNLYYWLRGLPGPGDKTKDDHHHQLTHINHQLWQATLSHYQCFNNLNLPTKFELSTQTHQPAISAKIDLSRWQL